MINAKCQCSLPTQEVVETKAASKDVEVRDVDGHVARLAFVHKSRV